MLKRNLKTFCKSEDGNAAIEYLFMAPVVLMLFAGTLTFFDAYRARFEAEAATNTIGDMVSRETQALSDDYIDGMLGVFESLAHRSSNEALRVSVVQYDADQDTHQVVWSQARNESAGQLTTADTQTMGASFPLMGHLDRVVYIETKTGYGVPFGLVRETLLDDFEIRNDIVVAPRFASTVCYSANAGVTPTC